MKSNGPSAPPCGTPLVGWTHQVVPTSVPIAYIRVARYVCKNPANGRPICFHMAFNSRCGLLGKAPFMPSDVMMFHTKMIAFIEISRF